MKQPPIQIIKGDDGLRRMFLVSSNNFEDREREWVTEDALKGYVADCWKGDEWVGDNVLMFWHAGDPIGEMIDADYEESFLLEVARELPDAPVNLAREGEPEFMVSIRAVWDALEAEPSGWGASIGFKASKKDKLRREFRTMLKHETSVLPISEAANLVTLSEIVRSEDD